MRFFFNAAVIFLCALLAAAWCSVADRKYLRAVRGRASYYGDGYRGKRMANGERFDPDARTCASFAYELGTVLRVTCVRTGRQVLVTVTDRGPALMLHRTLDLSRRAFADIAPTKWGVIDVEIEVVAPAEVAP